MFIEVREPLTGKLLFRYDPERGLIEVQRRRVKTLVDLRELHVEEPERGPPVEVAAQAT